MVANEPPDEPKQQNSDTPDTDKLTDNPEELQDSLWRGLGNSKEKPIKPVTPPLTDEEMMNDRLSIFMDTSESTSEKNDTWLDNFWNNEIPDNEKLNDSGSTQNGLVSEASDAGESSQVTDNYLFEEWSRVNESKNEPAPGPAHNFSNPFDYLLPEPSEDPNESLFSLPEPHRSAFLDDATDSPPKQEASSIFSVPENRSSDSLVEMRSWIEDDQALNSDEYFGAAKPIQENKPVPQKLNRLEIFLIAFIILLVLTIGTVLIRSIYFAPATNNQIPTPAPFLSSTKPEILPNPTELMMTGGWRFPLKKSTMVNNQWKPNGPEWLTGAEVSRIVTLPWNAQLEAIVHSLKIGDTITLRFDNQTELNYSVQKAEQVPVIDGEKMNSTTPSLVIILYGQDSPTRWVIVCLP